MKPQHSIRKANYWFPAKRYGWGWGLPCSWQGWIVMVAYVILLVCALFIVNPEVNKGGFVVSVLTINIVMLLICWFKGEPLSKNGR